MRNSLLVKLVGSFIVVIVISAVVISLMTSRATINAFNLYTSRNGQVWAQQIAPDLGDYYSATGSWQGVDVLLQAQEINAMPGMMNGNPGMIPSSSGMMPGAVQDTPAAPGPFGRFRRNNRPLGGAAMMEQRILLVDTQGRVISDTDNQVTGQTLPASVIKNGTPVNANGQQVGTLLVSPRNFQSNTPAGQFLVSVRRSIWVSVVIAALLAVLVGSLLFFQIISPIQKLKAAAHAIADGDLNKRVDIQSKDELGDLGSSFNHMAKNLSQAETLRRNMVADVAHELRTPLTVMQANLEGIQDGVLPLDMEQIEALHAQTLLLNRLVADLRLLSLAEAGQLKLERAETDLGKLVRQAGEQFATQAHQKDVELTIAVPEQMPLVMADSDRIRQILANLVDNALRYTPEHGQVTIQVETYDQGVKVSVTDTGPGVAPADLPNIFDRFYRADRSRNRGSGGSGLGLAIVRQLVQAHGGQVGAESPVAGGRGTRIWFTLP